ncbi:hypothetical protein RND71_019314 [Anisodus tanguticus]|uniref:Uncharacterized protein n=1 Tax=Anisodus tanguticus TaxID=243964 RepID=A0AAE1S099_9SOLA|nr:hypothetical protein RND71_019314 [Anisodus tanguticus]
MLKPINLTTVPPLLSHCPTTIPPLSSGKLPHLPDAVNMKSPYHFPVMMDYEIDPCVDIASQRHATNDSIIINMYVMQHLQLTLGTTTATLEQLVEIDERVPLSYYAMILCKQGEAFSDPLDDDMPKSEPEPHEEPASEEEAEAAAQAS